MSLTNADRKHWGPVPQVTEWLRDRFGSGTVLDVGPGHAPLPWAKHAVDFVDVPNSGQYQEFWRGDLARDPLPFPDKFFDFVYARHILEDMYNPFPLIAEMSRVGRAGYVETPSPIAELCRGVDGASPPYRGYHHHRFIAWVHQGEFRFVSKYPLIEYLSFDESALASLLRQGPRYWNSYYLWEDKINAVHRQSPLDFDIPRDYRVLLEEAAQRSKASSDEFFARGIPEQTTIPNLNRAYA